MSEAGVEAVAAEYRIRELEAENRELRRMVTTFHVWEGEGITLAQHDARVQADMLDFAAREWELTHPGYVPTWLRSWATRKRQRHNL